MTRLDRVIAIDAVDEKPDSTTRRSAVEGRFSGGYGREISDQSRMHRASIDHD